MEVGNLQRSKSIAPKSATLKEILNEYLESKKNSESIDTYNK